MKMSQIPEFIWKKKGLIYRCENREFFKTHCTRPIPYLIDQSTLRIFFSSRNASDMPFPTYIDVDPNDPSKILFICEEPMMALGATGTFDDHGITPVSVVRRSGGSSLMYYAGWKRRRCGVTIETSIGVAELNPTCERLNRLFDGPIIGQDRTHPVLTAAPFVVKEGGDYRMWYCSGSKWVEREHGPEMLYTVFEAHSHNGFDWTQASSNPCIPLSFEGEVVSAPWVERLGDHYIMWYSTRGSSNPITKRYSPGMAISLDGSHWQRCDELVGLEKSDSGWDSEMACYPAVFSQNGRTLIFYSGNAVGMGGIGYAELPEPLAFEGWSD